MRSVANRNWITLALVLLVGVSVEVYTLAWRNAKHVEARGPHPTLLTEFGDGTPIAQAFPMRNDGLSAVRVVLSSSATADVTFDWLLSEEQAPNTLEPIAGHRQHVERLSGRRWETISFPPILRSANRIYRLDLHLVDVTPARRDDRPVVAVAASLDHMIQGGYSSVGGSQRWGDLVFDTRAMGDTIFGRFALKTRPTIPGPLRSSPALWGLFVAYNLCLVSFVGYFMPSRASVFPAGESANVPSTRGTKRALAALLALVACLAIVDGYRQRPPEIDLLDELYAAKLSSKMPMRTAFDVVEEGLNSDPVRALWAHPTATVVWTLTVPPHGRLRTMLGIDPRTWEIPVGDGVVFRIGVTDGGRYAELFMRRIDPARVVADRRWTPVDLDLSSYAGRRIELTFQTDASLPGRDQDFNYDWAMWGAPGIWTE